MRRRDIPKVLLASVVTGQPPAAQPAANLSTVDLQSLLRVRGAVRIPAGTHQVTGKLQTLVPNDISGDSRHDTALVPDSFADFVFEVGNGSPGPNAGRIARLKFHGAHRNLGCLHMNTLSHMWHLDDLIFQGGPCPALVVDNCWDSNYTNIDILGHVSPGDDPAKTAAVIFKNGCNNIYCRGLRIEGGLSGGIFVDGGPIYVLSGKIDDGFGGPQSAPAVTVVATGALILDNFYFGGMLNRFHLDVSGMVRLGKVAFDGGTNSPAAINDRRAWSHIDKKTHPSVSSTTGGPFIPGLDLGEAQFHRFHPSVASETPAAVYSRIHPIRQVKNLAVRANGGAAGQTRTVATSLHTPNDDLFKNSFLVHNSTGTRRRILSSSASGDLVLDAVEPVPVDSDWSIEYCASHETPIRHENVWLDAGVTLFAVVANPVFLRGTPAYVDDPGDVAYGTTRIGITGLGVTANKELRGLFLIDNLSDEAYYIEYGMDAHGVIGVIYDRRSALDTQREFRVAAGHVANRDSSQRQLVQRSANTSSIFPDLSRGTQFEVRVTNSRGLTIDSPVGEAIKAGCRITLTLINATPEVLGVTTWDPIYRLAPWVNPAPAHSRSIDFRYDGRRWVEVARTPADVPD
jgi:hypothetical protein